MDFINKAFAQLKDLFQGMTPGSRITAGLLVAVLVASLAYLFKQNVNGSDAFLFNAESFSTSELQAMEGAFAAAGLNDYEIEGSKICVPRSEKSKYVAALAEGKALPRNFGNILDSALESSNIFESRDQREARLKTAREKELSHLFSEFPALESAAVLFGSETTPGLLKEKFTTATVFVKPLGNAALDAALVSSICQTMRGAVPGLDPENVVVTDQNTGRAWRGDPEDQSGGLSGSYAAKKREYEELYETKILSLLSLIPGVIVTPNVELHRETSFRERTITPDPKPIAYQRTESSTTRSQDGAENGGRPGYVAQGNTPRTLAPTPLQGSHEEEETTDLSESSLIGGVTSEKDYAGLTPELVTVSIAVPASYFRKVWQEQNPAKPGEPPQEPTKAAVDQIQTAEIARVKSLVAPLLPPVEGTADPQQLVQVSVFQDIRPEALPQPTLAENTVTWLGESWRTLGLVMLGFASLLVLRSVVNGSPRPAELAPVKIEPPVAAAAAPPAADAPREPEPKPKDEKKNPRQVRFRGGGLSLKDELSELVREDPDTAANILRNWIGNITVTAK